LGEKRKKGVLLRERETGKARLERQFAIWNKKTYSKNIYMKT